MAGKDRHYFTCANSAQGFVNYFDSNLAGIDKIFILKGGPGNGKSTLMRKIAQRYLEEELDVDYIHCSGDPDSLDGIIIPKLSVAIVDGTEPHVIEPKVPGAVEEYINLGAAWNTDYLAKRMKEIVRIKKEISEQYPKAYTAFAKAIRIHDEWEKIYIRNMDFDKANEIADFMIRELLDGVQAKSKGIVRHRFFGGATCLGPVDFVDNLTLDMKKRYFIKGRPGSGKSTMMKKILQRAEKLSLDVEVYHCGFDTNSLDMLLFPELKVCIFDSTAPHEYSPSREGDYIIDMYDETIASGTDEMYAQELEDIKLRYQSTIKSGTTFLKKAKSLHDELEAIYVESTDFKVITELTGSITEAIDHIYNCKIEE